MWPHDETIAKITFHAALQTHNTRHSYVTAAHAAYLPSTHTTITPALAAGCCVSTKHYKVSFSHRSNEGECSQAAHHRVAAYSVLSTMHCEVRLHPALRWSWHWPVTHQTCVARRSGRKQFAATTNEGIMTQTL